MIKEIGSIFPLYKVDERKKCQDVPSQQNCMFFSLARESLLYLAKTIQGGNHTVMLPAYTCQTVIDPFEQENWKCIFYDIQKSLRINEDSFTKLLQEIHPEVVVFHPYYGYGLSAEEEKILREAKETGAIIIEDMTQTIFADRKYAFVDYYIGSLRKWMDIPDGAFLISKGNTQLRRESYPDNEPFVKLQKDAMYLRGSYFQSGDQEIKQISIRLNKYAGSLVSSQNIVLHGMSDFSKQIYEKNDLQENQKRRWDNFRFLQNALKNDSICNVICNDISEVESAPLYLPIYVSNRSSVQKKLAENGIYAPVLWPVLDERTLVSDEVKYIYDNILLLPIDQRYSIADMASIASLLIRKKQ